MKTNPEHSIVSCLPAPPNAQGEPQRPLRLVGVGPLGPVYRQGESAIKTITNCTPREILRMRQAVARLPRHKNIAPVSIQKREGYFNCHTTWLENQASMSHRGMWLSLAQALQQLHFKGLVHGHLAPANLRLSEGQLVLVDSCLYRTEGVPRGHWVRFARKRRRLAASQGLGGESHALRQEECLSSVVTAADDWYAFASLMLRTCEVQRWPHLQRLASKMTGEQPPPLSEVLRTLIVEENS